MPPPTPNTNPNQQPVPPERLGVAVPEQAPAPPAAPETASAAPAGPPAPPPAAPKLPTAPLSPLPDPAQPAAPPPAPNIGPTPAVAGDVDVIEKEWVDQADKIIEQTKGDPYVEEEAEEALQQDYLKKRYNHDVKKPDAI